MSPFTEHTLLQFLTPLLLKEYFSKEINVLKPTQGPAAPSRQSMVHRTFCHFLLLFLESIPLQGKHLVVLRSALKPAV